MATGFSQTTSIDDIVQNFSSHDGQTRTIEGVLLNDFGKIRNDRTSIYVVSPSGHALSISSSNHYTNLKRGDRVSVTGTIGEFGDVYQISPSSAPTVLASNVAIPAPIEATVEQIQNAEFKGDYVKVSGQIVDLYATGSSGINIEVGDNKRPFAAERAVARIWSSTGITLAQLEERGISVGKIITMQGGTGSFNGAGQIIPTEISDFSVGILSDIDYPNRESFVEVPAKVYDVKSSQGVDITIKAPAGAEVRLAIYSFNGRKIKSFNYFLSNGASQIILWDFLSDDYQRVKLGTYLVFLEAVEDNGRKSVHKVPVVVGARL